MYLKKPDSGAISTGSEICHPIKMSPTPGPPLRKVVLISNTVMHYRVSLYNYFHRRFYEEGFEFSVIADSLQSMNQTHLEFGFQEIPFLFSRYRKAIADIQPHAVIIFLHLKDLVIWPLIHWLKIRRIPFAFWTKGGNWDAKESRLRYHMFNYIHGIADALILYSQECRSFLKPKAQSKVFIANNTINFEDFPEIPESKEEIKRHLGIPFKKVVLFAGRMDANEGRKRVDHLIEIFRDLDRSDTGLVIVGSGMNDTWKTRINPQTTVYLGEIHDPENQQISRIFKMADLFAIPGHVGLGLNQAFYFGLPVVTEAGNHPPEIAYLKSGRNGFIVPENDRSALKTRILELLDNDSLRREFARNARRDILAEASTEGMYQEFKRCVRNISEKSLNLRQT